MRGIIPKSLESLPCDGPSEPCAVARISVACMVAAKRRGRVAGGRAKASERLRRDAAAYLKRDDARQPERVRTLLRDLQR